MAFIKITPEIEQFFLDKIEQLLVAGRTTTTIQKKQSRKVRQVNVGAEDLQHTYVPVERHYEYTETTNIKHEETPEFVLQLISDSLSVDKAVEYLQNKGYLVIDPTEQKDELASNQGLSDSTIETIKQKILGVE